MDGRVVLFAQVLEQRIEPTLDSIGAGFPRRRTFDEP
jgi:hypothetical protein